jgi:hypothetical protein
MQPARAMLRNLGLGIAGPASQAEAQQTHTRQQIRSVGRREQPLRLTSCEQTLPTKTPGANRFTQIL